MCVHNPKLTGEVSPFYEIISIEVGSISTLPNGDQRSPLFFCIVGQLAQSTLLCKWNHTVSFFWKGCLSVQSE